MYVRVRVEWDEKKNKSNQTKHGIEFETAQLIFDDPFCITFIERIVAGEQRWHAIGSIENLIVLVVVHTYRGKDSDEEDEIIRIISARRATQLEKKLYVQAIG